MMRTMIQLAAATAVLTLAGCGEEKAVTPAAAETPQTLAAGEYEVSSEVTKLASADKSTPATKIKRGDKTTVKGCVGDDGKPDMALFVEAGDKCTATSSYVRSGRVSIQYQCNRPGHGGLYPNVDGNITAGGFEALVNTSTAFSGDGDYTLSRHLTAKRVGNCPAEVAAKV